MQSQQHDPNQWPVPPNGRRSQCNVTFEIALPGVISAMTEARYDHIASDGRPVPFPQKAVSEIRHRKAAETAQEAARSSGCPCIMRGYVGEDDGQTPKLFSNGCTCGNVTATHMYVRSAIDT